jgi:hypothetical protein
MLNYIALSRALDKNIRYLVIGDPVSHSRSPGLQNAAFEAAGLGRPYARMQVDAKDMAEFVDFARKHLLGVNLTVPHKNIIVPFCDTISTEALMCGSVNTLKIEDGKIHGHSTDGVPDFPDGLLRAYPFLDEQPGETTGFYARHLCPTHPLLPSILFDLMDEMMDAFEEGRKLVAFCNAKLSEVQQRVEKIKASETDGTLLREPFN